MKLKPNRSLELVEKAKKFTVETKVLQNNKSYPEKPYTNLQVVACPPIFLAELMPALLFSRRG